jgi:excisionase family DNA binding protein
LWTPEVAAALVVIPLPDGRWLGLSAEALQEALARGAALGLGATATAPTAATPERWLTSEELGALIGLHSTTVEAMSKRGEIPSMRAGKALRFKASEVEAAIRARAKD